MDVWTDRHTAGDTDGWTDSPCVLQDFVPFGAAAKKGDDIFVSAKMSRPYLSFKTFVTNGIVSNLLVSPFVSYSLL